MTTEPISDTPETDKANLIVELWDGKFIDAVPINLARNLERERDELKRELQELREYFKTLPTLKPEP